MDIFFHDPTDLPLPPDEVHIRKFEAKPYPDNRRVRVYLEISPFQKRPSGEVSIFDSEENEVASVSIIETVDPRMEMTLHMHGVETQGNFIAKAEIYYTEPLPEENGEENQTLPERNTIDTAEMAFQIVI